MLVKVRLAGVHEDSKRGTQPAAALLHDVKVNVNTLPAVSMKDFDNSG